MLSCSQEIDFFCDQEMEFLKSKIRIPDLS